MRKLNYSVTFLLIKIFKLIVTIESYPNLLDIKI